jgi:hypothetical protein
VNRIVIKPVKCWFSKRQQWTFDLVAANGEPIDPRETVFNRGELVETLTSFITTDPIELLVLDRAGVIAEQRVLR